MSDLNPMRPTGTASYFWWAKLVVAVLAVPSLASVIASSLPLGDIGQLLVFITACWICTYLGMKLMQSADDKE